MTEGGGDTVDAVDPYELVDPVEILSKLPPDFYEKMVTFMCLLFSLFLIKVLSAYFLSTLLPLFWQQEEHPARKSSLTTVSKSFLVWGPA